MIINLRSKIGRSANYGASKRLFTNDPSITKVTQFHLLHAISPLWWRENIKCIVCNAMLMLKKYSPVEILSPMIGGHFLA